MCQWECTKPNTYGKWVFTHGIATRLVGDADIRTLQAVAERKMANPEAKIADLTGGLGTNAQGVLRFVTNDDPGRSKRLLAKIPKALREDMDGLRTLRQVAFGSASTAYPDSWSEGCTTKTGNARRTASTSLCRAVKPCAEPSRQVEERSCRPTQDVGLGLKCGNNIFFRCLSVAPRANSLATR